MLYLPLNNQTILSISARSSRDYFLNLLNQNNIQGVSYDELDRYLNSSVDNRTDSLIWWKFHKKDYPILSQIAKDYLAIQATSVPSERAFSISGLTISKTRNRLDPETARAIICMKNWIGKGEMENWVNTNNVYIVFLFFFFFTLYRYIKMFVSNFFC